MTNIYKGQSALRISGRTGTALADVTSCEMRYEKPDGTRGIWTAFVSNAERGVVSDQQEPAVARQVVQSVDVGAGEVDNGVEPISHGEDRSGERLHASGGILGRHRVAGRVGHDVSCSQNPTCRR